MNERKIYDYENENVDILAEQVKAALCVGIAYPSWDDISPAGFYFAMISSFVTMYLLCASIKNICLEITILNGTSRYCDGLDA